MSVRITRYPCCTIHIAHLKKELVLIYYLFSTNTSLQKISTWMKKELYEQTNNVLHVIIKMLLYEVYQYS